MHRRIVVVCGFVLAAFAVLALPAPASANQSSYCVQLESEGKPAGECWALVAEELKREQEEAERAESERGAERAAEEQRQIEAFAAEEAAREAKEKREKLAIQAARREQREEAALARREAARHRREWQHKPTVTEAIAKEMSARLLRKAEVGAWWTDCEQPGRINRTTWVCKASIFYRCLRGRIRITGAGIKDGRKYYSATGGRLRQCHV